MSQPTKKHTPDWAEMDTSLFELDCATDLMEAVHTAIQSNELPNNVCANALFGACMLLQHVTKDLKREFYGDAPQQPDRGSF